ncbi:aldo/keto reductase family oxidoreductase [Flavobacterium sp. CS20]|uniref:aldo/keto reductase n=1 Tax=Flavobacterium sp. CS20 TaxID=2775246 RepID=UPI001B3A3BB4|nr:aldo/keto reductase [Flavobacterium sp. CS20]QTY26593.1 aldo/keto reductase [Flavobacterium sp. CS20]
MKLNFSRIIQGCMTWGVWGKNFNTSEMAKRISENVDIGVTTFDHADIYGNYTTEKAFGQAFQQSELQRNKIQLISKCGIQLINEERDSYVKHYNYDSSYIIKQAEQSLKNLKTDYLDLFLLHQSSPLMQNNEILEAVTQLKKQGKIKAFGVSNFTPQQIDYISQNIEVSANQIECSLTHTQPIDDDTLLYHQQNNITTMAWSPLGESLKLGENSVLKQNLNKLSKQYNCSISQLVLAWLLHHPAQIYPVIGTTNPKRVKAALGSLDITLKHQDWFVLYEAARGHEVS